MSAVEDSLWSLGGKNVGQRPIRGGVRTVKLDDRQVRILPKYRRRRRRLPLNGTSELASSAHGSDDDAPTVPNGRFVRAPPSTSAAQRWIHAARKTAVSVGGTGRARSLRQVLVGRPEVDSPAGTLRSLQSVPSDSDDDELGEEKVDGSTSDNGDYDADVDDELNASSRLMLSRIIAAKLRAALPVSTVREHSRIDEHDQDDDDDENATVRPRTTRERVVSCCRSFVSFLASTVGLTCLLVVYILLGGALFVGLEAQYERVVQTDVMATRDEYVRQLWNITERMNVLHPRNWSAVAEQLLLSLIHI